MSAFMNKITYFLSVCSLILLSSYGHAQMEGTWEMGQWQECMNQNCFQCKSPEDYHNKCRTCVGFYPEISKGAPKALTDHLGLCKSKIPVIGEGIVTGGGPEVGYDVVVQTSNDLAIQEGARYRIDHQALLQYGPKGPSPEKLEPGQKVMIYDARGNEIKLYQSVPHSTKEQFEKCTQENCQSCTDATHVVKCRNCRQFLDKDAFEVRKFEALLKECNKDATEGKVVR